jgi:hypothetical protein
MTKEEIERAVFEKYPYEHKESWCWNKREYLKGKREALRNRLYDEAGIQRETYKTDEQTGEDVHS